VAPRGATRRHMAPYGATPRHVAPRGAMWRHSYNLMVSAVLIKHLHFGYFLLQSQCFILIKLYKYKLNEPVLTFDYENCSNATPFPLCPGQFLMIKIDRSIKYQEKR
jgi:hypothetical protein